MNIQEIKKSYEEKLKQLQESLSLLGQYDDNEDVINITSNRLFYQIISGYSVQKYLQGGWIWNQINFTLLQKWQKNVFL